MTEAKWTTSTNPHELLKHLGDQASERKLRLLASACARRIWPMFRDKRTRNAIEVAELYADGMADEKKLALAQKTATDAVKKASEHTLGHIEMVGFWIAKRKLSAAVREALSLVVRLKAQAAKDAAGIESQAANAWTSASVAELDAQAKMVREVFVNPLHPVIVNSEWLHWKDGSVVRLAQAIYDEQMFGDLPKLATALKKAGCDNAAILSHCHQAGEHCRGCWMLDLLLGKA